MSTDKDKAEELERRLQPIARKLWTWHIPSRIVPAYGLVIRVEAAEALAKKLEELESLASKLEELETRGYL